MSTDPIPLSGILHDGVSSADMPVEVLADTEGLRVIDPGSGAESRWLADEIRIAYLHGKDTRLTLAHSETSDMRLTIENAGQIRRLRLACPAIFRRRRLRGLRQARAIAATLAALVVVGLIVRAGMPLVVDAVSYAMPHRTEVRLGNSVRELVSKAIPDIGRTCIDGEGVAVLDRLTRDLLSDIANPPALSVEIVPVGMNNAIALPGGQILIAEGLLRQPGDIGNLVAGVLAHEMGHVVHRHPARQMVRNNLLGALTGILIPDAGIGSSGAMTGTILQKSYSRDAEREADRFAADRLNARNIAPADLIRFLQTLGTAEERQGMSRTLSLLESHPAGAERVAFLQQTATGTGKALSAEDRKALERICASVETWNPDRTG